ncbi:hypothetical protein BJY52DRAFT_1192013 [Lactarius psammicola]|nr:hypothetical protein BJY52DRAFT_1192013 [Lactarius psammicola]
MAPLPGSSFDSLQSTVRYTQPSVQEVTAAGSPVHAGLSDRTKRFIWEATANLQAIWNAKTLNVLPQETRNIIREAVEMRAFQPAPHASPEVIFVRSSTADPCDVIIPPSRPASVTSVWSHVTRETNDTGYTQNFRNTFPEIRIKDFVDSINDALQAPVLEELCPSIEDPSWGDPDGTVERIKTELMVELGRNVSESQTGYAHFYLAAPLQLHKDNDYPCSNEGFNLSAALVIAALDSGVEDNRGDLEQAGMVPSSWFQLTSAILGAILCGALRSGGRKIQGCIKIDQEELYDWKIADGLTPPVTQGGRIATQAQQLTNFFMHYAGSDEPPLAEFYDSVLQVGQNHIEKVVRLKAVATYQASVSDVQGLTDMVLEDMSRQVYSHMVTDEQAHHKANQRSLDRLFVEAQEQLTPFMNEWKTLYKHYLIQALKDDEEAREEAPARHGSSPSGERGEIHDSIARLVTDPILDGDEITRARERIRIDHAEEIEAARRETRAQISSEKKAWAVAYRDSNKLDWLTKVAEELGYVLVSKDDAKEHEGRMAKRRSGPSGKRERSGSWAVSATPGSVPATPENRPRKLDNSQTPKARKTKGKRPTANPRPLRSRSTSFSSQPDDLSDNPDVDMAEIKRPLFFASSYPETAAALQQVTDRTKEVTDRITSISVPQTVRPSQAPDAPLRNPKATLIEPDTDVSVHAVSRQPSMAPELGHSNTVLSPDRVLTPDSTRGVASSMHNPNNAMADDLLAPAPAPEAITVLPALPTLQPIPLLPGLAEMLNALQSNLMTSFTTQINHLLARIDAQDELIKIRPQTGRKGKAPQPNLTPHEAGPTMIPPAPALASGAPQNPNQEALPVPDPLPVPHPPPPSAAPRPPHAILPDKATWAGIVTPSNFTQNSAAKVQVNVNANIIGRTPGGAIHKGRGVNPTSIENTEITIARGEGLADKAAEAGLYKSNPANIVQAARSAMERMSAQAPPVLYGRWSVNANSHNFVYVFTGTIPFNIILQFAKALVKPLGMGNPLPNKGWTFAQLRGVPTLDGAGVIHSMDTLLQEIRCVPFFQDAIFVSKPHWQLPVTSLAHATQGVVQLAFIDETGVRSQTAKGTSLSSRSAGDATKLGMPPMHLCKPSLSTPSSSNNAQQVPTDADGFTLVGKNGKDATPPNKPSHSAKRAQARRNKKAAAASNPTGLQTAGPSNPNTNGANQGSLVMNVLFPDDIATITETVDAFRKLAYAVCDGSKEDLQCAMTELEGGWGVPTEHLDNLFSLPARYAVKHQLPLTIPQVEDTVARGEGGHEMAAERVRAFRAAWGSAQPIHFVYHSLPAATRFATEEEVEARRKRQAKTSDTMRQFSDAVEFTTNLAQSMFKNNIMKRPITVLEAEVIVTSHSLDKLFSLNNLGPIGDRVVDQIKTHLSQDSARLFSLSSITSYA